MANDAKLMGIVTVAFVNRRHAAEIRSGSVYSATVAACRSAADYAVRLAPFFYGAAVPLEAPQIPWQH